MFLLSRYYKPFTEYAFDQKRYTSFHCNVLENRSDDVRLNHVVMTLELTSPALIGMRPPIASRTSDLTACSFQNQLRRTKLVNFRTLQLPQKGSQLSNLSTVLKGILIKIQCKFIVFTKLIIIGHF